MLARRIDLGDALMLGRGELETGGNMRESTLSDTMESLLGAIMLDSNLTHVVDALQSLVGTIKNECVSEVEREA